MEVIIVNNNIILTTTNLKEKAFLESIKDVDFLANTTKRDDKNGLEERFIVLQSRNSPRETVTETIVQEVQVPVVEQKTENDKVSELVEKLEKLISSEEENKELRNKQVRLLEKTLEWQVDMLKDILNKHKADVQKLREKKKELKQIVQ